MTKSNNGGFPSITDVLLLKAALYQNNEAIASYKKWKSLSNIDDINPGVARLLPLLADNLIKLNYRDELTPKLNGLKKRTWLANQRLFSQTLPILKQFQQQCIPLIPLKGLATAIRCHNSFSTRPMDDIDILVPKRAIQNVIELLLSNQYTPYDRYSHIEHHFNYRHSLAFQNPQKTIIDIHCYILEDCCKDGDHHPFIEQTSTVPFKGLQLELPNATEHLFHTLIHGMRWNPTSPIRWVADSYQIIKQHPIDWQLLSYYGSKYERIVSLQKTLNFLSETFPHLIPVKATHSIHRLKPSQFDREKFSFHMASYNSLFKSVRYQIKHYYKSSSYHPNSNLLQFCQHYWGVKNISMFPITLLQKIHKKILP